MNKYSKAYRQKVLREIIDMMGIGDQWHLLRELKRRGIRTTQATISRDLHEMGVVKTRVAPGVYVYKYEVLGSLPKSILSQRLKIMFENFVVDVCGTENLILVKTSPGNAHGVASLIDLMKFDEVLGTIAGDDTILVVIKDRHKRKKIEAKFISLWKKEGKEEELDNTSKKAQDIKMGKRRTAVRNP
jgi:transcriptional regulator of arginine metabolism